MSAIKFGWQRLFCFIPSRHGLLGLCAINIIFSLAIVIPEIVYEFTMFHGRHLSDVSTVVFLIVLSILASDVLQFIGLVRKNHFLLLPFFTTCLVRVLFTVFITLTICIFGRTRDFYTIEYFTTVAFMLLQLYAFFINVVVYRKLSSTYHLGLRWSNRTDEPNLKFSELVLGDFVERELSKTPEREDASNVKISEST